MRRGGFSLLLKDILDLRWRGRKMDHHCQIGRSHWFSLPYYDILFCLWISCHKYKTTLTWQKHTTLYIGFCRNYPFLRRSKAKFASTPTAATMAPAMSGLPSYLETWTSLPRAFLQTIFMVWLSKSVPCGQFTWLLEFLMLPVHSILVDLQRNQYKELQSQIRSWANLGCRHCYFVKSKHQLHHPHLPLLIHLSCPYRRGKPKGQELWAIVNDGVRQSSRRSKGAGASQAMTKTPNNNGNNDLTRKPLRRNLVHILQDLPVGCPFFYHHLLNQQKGSHGHRLDAIMQDWMDGLNLLLSYIKGFIIYQYCNDKNDADFDWLVIHLLPHTCQKGIQRRGGNIKPLSMMGSDD